MQQKVLKAVLFTVYHIFKMFQIFKLIFKLPKIIAQHSYKKRKCI